MYIKQLYVNKKSSVVISKSIEFALSLWHTLAVVVAYLCNLRSGLQNVAVFCSIFMYIALTAAPSYGHLLCSG